jgi:hypothetical protein
MDAILVDQVTAIYVVLAVAMAIFGGIYTFVWRLAGQAGLKGNTLLLGFVGLVTMWGALAVMALVKLVTAVDLMLVVAAIFVLIAWILIFSALWRLDSATG